MAKHVLALHGLAEHVEKGEPVGRIGEQIYGSAMCDGARFIGGKFELAPRAG